tara:strand:+ start:275 stop:478 length:204 start_codon:yes stop_codon:yes gene_type:complete
MTAKKTSGDAVVMLQNSEIAYIKVEDIEGEHGYAIHAADGTRIGWYNDREIAFAAVRQYALDPVSVH